MARKKMIMKYFICAWNVRNLGIVTIAYLPL